MGNNTNKVTLFFICVIVYCASGTFEDGQNGELQTPKSALESVLQLVQQGSEHLTSSQGALGTSLLHEQWGSGRNALTRRIKSQEQVLNAFSRSETELENLLSSGNQADYSNDKLNSLSGALAELENHVPLSPSSNDQQQPEIHPMRHTDINGQTQQNSQDKYQMRQQMSSYNSINTDGQSKYINHQQLPGSSSLYSLINQVPKDTFLGSSDQLSNGGPDVSAGHQNEDALMVSGGYSNSAPGYPEKVPSLLGNNTYLANELLVIESPGQMFIPDLNPNTVAPLGSNVVDGNGNMWNDLSTSDYKTTSKLSSTLEQIFQRTTKPSTQETTLQRSTGLENNVELNRLQKQMEDLQKLIAELQKQQQNIKTEYYKPSTAVTTRPTTERTSSDPFVPAGQYVEKDSSHHNIPNRGNSDYGNTAGSQQIKAPSSTNNVGKAPAYVAGGNFDSLYGSTKRPTTAETVSAYMRNEITSTPPSSTSKKPTTSTTPTTSSSTTNTTTTTTITTAKTSAASTADSTAKIKSAAPGLSNKDENPKAPSTDHFGSPIFDPEAVNNLANHEFNPLNPLEGVDLQQYIGYNKGNGEGFDPTDLNNQLAQQNMHRGSASDQSRDSIDAPLKDSGSMTSKNLETTTTTTQDPMTSKGVTSTTMESVTNKPTSVPQTEAPKPQTALGSGQNQKSQYGDLGGGINLMNPSNMIGMQSKGRPGMAQLNPKDLFSVSNSGSQGNMFSSGWNSQTGNGQNSASSNQNSWIGTGSPAKGLTRPIMGNPMDPMGVMISKSRRRRAIRARRQAMNGNQDLLENAFQNWKPSESSGKSANSADSWNGRWTSGWPGISSTSVGQGSSLAGDSTLTQLAEYNEELHKHRETSGDISNVWDNYLTENWS